MKIKENMIKIYAPKLKMKNLRKEKLNPKLGFLNIKFIEQIEKTPL